MAKKGDWVLTHTIVLTPQQRASQVPEDTHKVPLEMWVKGRLTADAAIGDEVSVITRTGRMASGTLLTVNPRFDHDFGDFVPELLVIGDTVREIVFGGEG
ncbi:MAG: 2-amino-4-oxopentanoate thiolase subunit OrtA [Clostridia bacterium]